MDDKPNDNINIVLDSKLSWSPLVKLRGLKSKGKIKIKGFKCVINCTLVMDNSHIEGPRFRRSLVYVVWYSFKHLRCVQMNQKPIQWGTLQCHSPRSGSEARLVLPEVIAFVA